MFKSTPESVKVTNKQAILSLIFNEGITSRVEIANHINLSKATVSTLVDELIMENIIMEKGEGISTKQGGRKPINLMVNPEAFCIVGVDIGAYKTFCVITDAAGKILFQEKLVSQTFGDGYDLISILSKVKGMINNSGLQDKIIGIGIGIPGITDIENGIAVSVPSFKCNNMNIKELIRKEIGIDSYIDNNVNMEVLGEKWLGKGKNCKDFIFISIGHGIGSGIMINNKIYRGKNYSAGEIGYLALSKEAFKRGNYDFNTYGYFESVASASAVEKNSGLSCEEIFNYYYEDKRYQDTIDEMTDYLGMGISNIIDILNPEAVIIGGGVSNAKDKILLPITEKVSKLTPVPCKISISELGEQSGVMGCIATVISNKYGISFY